MKKMFVINYKIKYKYKYKFIKYIKNIFKYFT